MKKTIEMVMTPNVHSIGSDISLKTAHEQMHKFGIRHLPVLSRGEVVGVLSDRDIKLVSKFPGYEDLSVEDAMTPDPYVVSPDTPFHDVVTAMAERKLGSAIVAEKKNLLGIFTAMDALKLLMVLYK